MLKNISMSDYIQLLFAVIAKPALLAILSHNPPHSGRSSRNINWAAKSRISTKHRPFQIAHFFFLFPILLYRQCNVPIAHCMQEYALCKGSKKNNKRKKKKYVNVTIDHVTISRFSANSTNGSLKTHGVMNITQENDLLYSKTGYNDNLKAIRSQTFERALALSSEMGP